MGDCLYEISPDREAAKVLRAYGLCMNSMGRFCWPNGGGPGNEDASIVYLFSILDQVILSKSMTAERFWSLCGRK